MNPVWRHRVHLFVGNRHQSEQLSSYQIGTQGHQVDFDPDGITAWVLESSVDLTLWPRLGRFLGPIGYLFPMNSGTEQFIRAVIE